MSESLNRAEPGNLEAPAGFFLMIDTPIQLFNSFFAV